MNWFTRCPACATVYKVVPDQLRVASGWLRCGHCQHAFDSTGLVLDWSDATAADAAGGLPQAADQRLVIDELLHHEDRSAPVSVASTDSTPPSDKDTMSELTAFSDALSSFRPGMPSPERQDSCLPEGFSSPAQLMDSDRSTVTDVDEAPPPSARGRGISRVAVWVLVLLFFAQGVWSQRHAWVTFFPATAPWAQQLCHALGCQIRPWRQPEGVVIDSSAFVQQTDGFALRWTVRNTTALTLGMTALELKLQDAQDKVLVRRVFTVAEVGAPVSLSPGQTWSGQLFIEVDADLPVTGYRLLSFYP